MGYAGGTLAHPTYHRLGDHTETLQVDFDPQEVSYVDLLEIFWESHNPFREPWSRQYMSLVICHDDEQHRLFQRSKSELEQRFNKVVYTLELPDMPFTLAEGYHQKYYLRRVEPVMDFLTSVYQSEREFIDSTAAARLNGYVGGYASRTALAGEIERYGLPESARKALLGPLSTDVGCSA